MTEQFQSRPGQVVWADLTIPNAEQLREFYHQVTGWEPQPVDMGGYLDYNMTLPGSDTPAAGICHARGENANIPPQWLIYIAVDDLDTSVALIEEFGGRVLVGPVGEGSSRFCVIEDPAGAVCALVQAG